MEKIKLNNGVEMPILGLGTFMISPEDAFEEVKEGLKMGYRLIDTANMYLNEKAVGRAIKESGVPREEIFVSTKLWITEYENENAVDETLERLGLDYIDLLFIHQPGGNYLSGYKLLEKAYKEGKIKAIGISNLEGRYFDDVMEHVLIKPQVLQAERHPYYIGKEMQEKIKENNLKVMSWYPLGHGDKSLIEESIFKELGEKYVKTPAQIILRWHTQMGYIVIPGSKNVNHIKENFDIFDFTLTDEEMQKIEKLDTEKRYCDFTQEMFDGFAKMKPEYEK